MVFLMLLVLPAGTVRLWRAVGVYGSRWYCPLVMIIVLLVLLIFLASPIDLGCAMCVDGDRWYSPTKALIISSARDPRL